VPVAVGVLDGGGVVQVGDGATYEYIVSVTCVDCGYATPGVGLSLATLPSWV